MKPLSWLQDTIAFRFAVTIFLAVTLTVALISLCFVFGGEWAQPQIKSSAVYGLVAGLIKAVDAAPPQMRQGLATAASSSIFRCDWYGAASPVSVALEKATDVEDVSHPLNKFLGAPYGTVRIFKPENPVTSIPVLNNNRIQRPTSYFLAVKLTDESWIVLTTLNKRNLELDEQTRRIVWITLSVLSTALVSVIAARRLSKPVKQLAAAMRDFGQNPQAPEIAEVGPQELKQVIRTFNSMRTQIQKFVAYRTTMLAAISHDLRTPLTRIRLRGEFIEDAEQQERLFRDVEEMQTMVDGALAFFREDALEETTTTFDLPVVLHTIVNDYADQDIDIGYSGPEHGIYLGRPFALKRAFTNLIENAIKYATPPEIELSCSEKALVVAIRDHGPGIPAEALDRVFNPYYRLDKSRNRMTGGVGLGLTAAQAIIRGHGGEIVLDNRPGGGLEALVTLPMAGLSDQ